MKYTSIFGTLLITLSCNGTASFGQTYDTIARPDIAAAHCPAQWTALVALAPDTWADSNPINIDPELTQSTTDALNKYVLAIMASADHVSSIIGFAAPDAANRGYFDKAQAQYELWNCLKLTASERDLVVDLALLSKPTYTRDAAAEALFAGFNEYACSGFEQASADIFALDPESDDFQSGYDAIMAGVRDGCG